jgi:carbohydrate diacid regulator
MDERDVKIILAIADSAINLNAAARAVFMHRNTLVYHICKIKKITGLDATDFYDLCKLVEMVAKNEMGRDCNG